MVPNHRYGSECEFLLYFKLSFTPVLFEIGAVVPNHRYGSECEFLLYLKVSFTPILFEIGTLWKYDRFITLKLNSTSRNHFKQCLIESRGISCLKFSVSPFIRRGSTLRDERNKFHTALMQFFRRWNSWSKLSYKVLQKYNLDSFDNKAENVFLEKLALKVPYFIHEMKQVLKNGTFCISS